MPLLGWRNFKTRRMNPAPKDGREGFAPAFGAGWNGGTFGGTGDGSSQVTENKGKSGEWNGGTMEPHIGSYARACAWKIMVPSFHRSKGMKEE